MLRLGLCYYLMIVLIAHAPLPSTHRDNLKLTCHGNVDELEQFFYLQRKLRVSKTRVVLLINDNC